MATNQQKLDELISIVQKLSKRLGEVEMKISKQSLNINLALPSFDGQDSSKALLWLTNCQGLLEANKIDQSFWPALMVVKLTGSAAMWYRGHMNSENWERPTWYQFEKAFRERWVTKYHSIIIVSLVEKWKWKGDMEQFYRDYDRIRAYTDDIPLEHYFIERLPEIYVKAVEISQNKGHLTILSWRERLFRYHDEISSRHSQPS